jgi:hypothetical protein
MLYPIKIEFKDYPSGSWQDWSTYLLEPPVISKKVESENDGEAGAIVFDVANVKLKYASGSPVHTAFSADLSVKQRYVFRISAPKSDKTYVQLFEGMADFSTLRWPDYAKAVSFDIVDKLSALNILQNTGLRTLKTFWENRPTSMPALNWAAGEYYSIVIQFDTGPTPPIMNFIRIDVFKHLSPSFTPVHIDISADAFLTAGQILVKEDSVNGNLYALAVQQYFDDASYPGENDTIIIAANDTDNLAATYYLTDTDCYLSDDSDIKLKFYDDEYLGETVSNISYVYNSTISRWVYILTSFKGEIILKRLIIKAWPDITVTFRGVTTFNIPYSYWRQTMSADPFNRTPLDAVKMLADTFKSYVFIDKTGNCIVQSKAHLATSGTVRTIGTTKIISGPEKRYFWDKLVDGVEVTVQSWVLDPETGKNLIGYSEMTKQPSGFSAADKIKPKNSITKDILASSDDMDTQAEIDAHAASEALSILNFYGLRHSAFDLTLDLDDNTINWELIDLLEILSDDTFFTSLEFDCAERTVTLEPVEITGHDYDLRSIVVGSPEDSASSTVSGSTSGTTGGGSGVSYAFNIPLVVSGGIVSLAYTNNLKITSNQLDTAQGIKTTDIPTFAQINLSGDPENAGNAVRAGRTISTNYPLTGGSNLLSNITLSLGYNSTNLRLSSNLLNTVQDIATSSIPTFKGLITTLPLSLTDAPFGQLLFKSYNTNDLFYAMNRRFDLTLSGHQYNWGLDNLADGDYETVAFTILANTTATIHINLISKGEFDSINGFTYAYGGKIYIHTYGTSYPEGCTARLRTKNAGSTFEWRDLKTGINISPDGSYGRVFEIDMGGSDYFCSEIEINITARADSDCWVSGLNYWVSRNCETRMQPLVSKGTPTTTWFDFKVKDSNNTEKIILYNNGTIDVKNNLYVANNVGIGTQLPGYKLDVRGNAQILNELTTTNFYVKGATGQSSTLYVNADGDSKSFSIHTNATSSFLTGTGGLYFRVPSGNYIFQTGAGNIERLRIDTNGNVGINISTLTEKFNLEGHFKHSGNYSLYNNFTSGWTGSGWRLDYGITNNSESTLEIDNIWVRGTLNVFELVINQIRATNGSLFVTSSAKVKAYVTGDPGSIIVEDPYGHNIAPFAAGDILLIQRVRLDSTTIVKRIVKEVTSVSNTTVYIQNLADGPTATGIIEPGDVVVRIGNTDSTNYSNRQGAVYLTSDDSNAPYIDITNDVNNWAAWTSPTKIKARLGKLTGMSSTPFGELNGYGLYTQNAYLAGNANIWGTISAGDAYGFDPVFYAGRIQKNYAKISEGVDAGTTGYPLWAWTGNSNFVVGTTSTQTPGGSTGLVSTIRKSNSSGNVYAIIHGDTTRSWVAAGAYENKTWVISFWVRVSNAALAGNHTFYKYFYPTNQTDLGTQVVNITTEWKRVSLVFNCPNDPTSENYPRAVLELTYSATYNYQFHGLQIEEGSLSTIYQKTDGSTPVLTTGYGMWAIKGGFGGTIQNPNIALSDYGIVVRKNATASAVWVGNDTISIGFNGSTWGIIGKSGSSNIFELGSTNKIAGWTFDTEKFYNGNVRLSINSSDKGLVISQSSVDYVKVGDFTYNTSAFSYGPNNTTIDHIGYSGLDSSDFDSSSPYTDSTKWYQNAASNYYVGEITTYNPYWIFTQVSQVNTIIIGELTNIETWSLWISHRLDNIKLVMGKTLKFEYLLKFQDYFQNYSEHGGSYSVFLNYYNSSNSLIYQQRLEDNISVPDDPVNYGANNIFDRTGSNGITATFPVISGTSYIELNFVFNGGSQLGEYSPFSMMLSNFAINGYNKYFTYITPTGLEVYNAPDNYLRFSSLGVEIQAADLRVAGKPLVRFHGRLAAAPTASVSLGDVYIKTSDNSVNICYEINNQGIPQWKTI